MFGTIFSLIKHKRDDYLVNNIPETAKKIENINRNNVLERPQKDERHVKQQKETTTNKTECYGTVFYAESSDHRKRLLTVRFKNDIEHTVLLESLKWNVLVGDKVKLHFGEKSTECGKKFEIVDIEPSKIDLKICRVTALGENYAIFDDIIIMLYSTVEKIPQLSIFDEYRVEVIESEQDTGISSYEYRVLNLLAPVENKIILKRVKFEHSPFKIYLNENDRKQFGTKHIIITNISEQKLELMSMKVVPYNSEHADLIKFERKYEKINFKLQPKIGNYRAYFNINPVKTGKFYFNLIVNFKNFTEKHEFPIEILKAYALPSGERPFATHRFVDIKISEYAVPNDLKEIDYTNFKCAKDELENLYPSLKDQLMPLNYLERMKLGIYLEELTMEKAFANYHIDRTSFEAKEDYLKIHVQNIAEKRPSIIVGDKVVATEIIVENGRKERLSNEGYIHKLGNDLILVKFNSTLHESYIDKEFSVDFVYSRSLFRKLHHALETFLANGELGYHFLFPNDKICMKEVQLSASVDDKGDLLIQDRKHNWFNSQLNEPQKIAISNILRGEKRPLPYVLFGCPGSGKTMTIVETILQIHKHIKSAKIIVATPSNSAANLILEMLINSDVLDKDDPAFLRITGNNILEREMIPDYLMKYCGTVSIASEKDDAVKYKPIRNARGVLQNCTKSTILKYKIIVGTLSIFSCFMQMSIDTYFSHVIIDEAGQSMEPESLIALTAMRKKTQCILSGDPQQLGPIVLSRFGKLNNFDISLMERLLVTHPFYARNHGPKQDQYDPKFVSKLKINYRSHPSVLKIYNDLFYNSEMECAINGKDSLEELFLNSNDDLIWNNLNKNCGVIFVNVANGRNKRTPDSSSWYNDQEINAVMAFLNKCRSQKIPFEKIGVMAPYLLQVNKLKHQISFLNDTDLKVGTVEEFQGQERLVMIVSTVRTEECHLKADKKFSIGFLQCPKRINVAISRARALLVIFGKHSILERDPHWKRIIEHTKANNTYVTENY